MPTPSSSSCCVRPHPSCPKTPRRSRSGRGSNSPSSCRTATFRASVRRMAEYQAAERADGDRTGLHHDLSAFVRDTVARAIDNGIAPESPDAVPVLGALLAGYARTFCAVDSADYRASLLRRLDVANDPRAERYWQLLGTINGWPVQPTLAPIFEWFIRALRAHPRP